MESSATSHFLDPIPLVVSNAMNFQLGMVPIAHPLEIVTWDWYGLVMVELTCLVFVSCLDWYGLPDFNEYKIIYI